MRTIRRALSFDDILLEPSYSEVLPSEVDMSTQLGLYKLSVPILSAAMDTVTGGDMAKAIGKYGGMGVVHKNMSVDEQISIAVSLSNDIEYPIAAAIGVGTTHEDVHRLSKHFDFLVLDTAHASTKSAINRVRSILEYVEAGHLIVGNISTKEAALQLVRAGVRIIKVGQGPGSICTTRIVAGIGVPQFQAIYDIYEAIKGSGVHIIADGGIRNSGDIVKALAAGANSVMLGNLLAGTDESLGGTYYRGMGTEAAMTKGSSERYYQSDAKKYTPEGIEAEVESKGPVAGVLEKLVGGIRSGMGYTGSRNIEELQESNFVEITAGGLKESHPHDLVSIKQAPQVPFRRV